LQYPSFRQCSIHKNELEESIRKQETLLKELIKESPISVEMKERISCGFDDNDVIAGMFDDSYADEWYFFLIKMLLVASYAFFWYVY
jgi:hypothetical protein